MPAERALMTTATCCICRRHMEKAYMERVRQSSGKEVWQCKGSTAKDCKPSQVTKTKAMRAEVRGVLADSDSPKH